MKKVKIGEDCGKVLILDASRMSERAKSLAALCRQAFPTACEHDIQAAAWIVADDWSTLPSSESGRRRPHLQVVPEGATDIEVFAVRCEPTDDEYALAVVDGKIVDCRGVFEAGAEDMLPAEILEYARARFHEK